MFEAESSLRGDDGEGRVREELGKQFIAELGGLGRVLATAKFGMAPEMIELAEIVNASPELLEAMKNPAVKMPNASRLGSGGQRRSRDSIHGLLHRAEELLTKP